MSRSTGYVPELVLEKLVIYTSFRTRVPPTGAISTNIFRLGTWAGVVLELVGGILNVFNDG